MEVDRLTLFVLAAVALAFPQYLPHTAVAALVPLVWERYRRSRRREGCDRQVLELLFRLGARGDLTERAVVEEMRRFPCFEKLSAAFDRTSRLALPDFGWRSRAAAAAIRASLETGDASVVVKALEQVSRREDAMVEANSALASQKYTLIASIAVSSAILGLASSISGRPYLTYVAAQSLLSGIWLNFIGGQLHESLSLSAALSLTGYFLALRFL